MNALNGVQSDYVSANHNPERVKKGDKDFASELDLKTQNVQSKLEIFTKLKKRRILSSLVFLIMKTKKNIQTMYQKILLKNMLLYY